MSHPVRTKRTRRAVLGVASVEGVVGTRRTDSTGGAGDAVPGGTHIAAQRLPRRRYRTCPVVNATTIPATTQCQCVIPTRVSVTVYTTRWQVTRSVPIALAVHG